MREYGVKRIIFSSTGGALYGEADRIPTPEVYPTNPESPYGIAKRSIEHYLHFYHLNHGFVVTVLRYGNVYGPRQALKGEAGVVAVFIKKLLAGEQCSINGDGKQTRDFVNVRDVVRANIVAMHKEVEGTFNVGTGKETSINEVYDKVSKLLGFPWKAQHNPAIKGELKRSCLHIDAYKQYWRPTVSVDEGLRETVEWFRDYESNAKEQANRVADEKKTAAKKKIAPKKR
jgi:UDP-glucose 4-epimerase